MHYELVIFDIDGTLVDSRSIWAPAVQRAIREVFEEKKIVQKIPSIAAIESRIGIPGVQALEPLIEAQFHQILPEIASRVGHYGSLEMSQQKLCLFEGVLETLQELRRLKKKTALASNCGQSYITEVQESLGLKAWIDLPLCLSTPGVQDKSDMLAIALDHFQTRRAVMIGDRYLDYEAAQKNGIPFIGFSGGFGKTEEWPQADAVIHHYSELFPALHSSKLQKRFFKL